MTDPTPLAALREAVVHAARDVDGLWFPQDDNFEGTDLTFWGPEAGEALRDLRTAVVALDDAEAAGVTLAPTPPDALDVDGRPRLPAETVAYDKGVIAGYLAAKKDYSPGGMYSAPTPADAPVDDEPCARCGVWRRFHEASNGPEYSRDHSWVTPTPPDALDATSHTQESDANGVWCREDGQRWPCNALAPEEPDHA